LRRVTPQPIPTVARIWLGGSAGDQPTQSWQ